MDMKKIFFLAGLPRAGNTLLGSILNQNPDIAVTANSITPDILYVLYRVKNLGAFNNFLNHQSFNNIAHHVLDLYYKDWNYKYIIDRGPWGMPNNLKILKETQEDIKIIVLVRDIIEVLASFIRWSHNRTDTFINRYNIKTIEGKCDKLMQENSIIKNFASINYLLLPKHKDLYCLIEYNDLVKYPRKMIEKIYDFLKIPGFKHRYINLDQFEVNSMKYDDTIHGERLHTIKSDRISKSNYNAYTLIPKSIIEKYRQFNSWKN